MFRGESVVSGWQWGYWWAVSGWQSASEEENNNVYFISFLSWYGLRAVGHTSADFIVCAEKASDVWEAFCKQKMYNVLLLFRSPKVVKAERWGVTGTGTCRRGLGTGRLCNSTYARPPALPRRSPLLF